MQIRALEGIGVPIRMASAGRANRKNEEDTSHSPMFHQTEGIVVDKGITMADLKGTLSEVIRQIYGQDTATRFRPHHFLFTEPSCEVDIQCYKCGGKGCPACKGEGWVELLGTGEVVGGVVDILNYVPQPDTVKFEPEKMNRFLGVDVPAEDMKKTLLALDFGLEGDGIAVPSWRSDVEHWSDIAEEVARFYR